MRYGGARGGLWACALLIGFGPSCGSIARQQRTAVGVNAAYSHAEDIGFSCDDEPPIQRHHQVGGVAELSHVSSGPSYSSGRAIALTGVLEESSNIGVAPDRSPYVFVGLGGTAGWEFEYVAHELGATLVLLPQAIGNNPWVLPMPYYRLQLGHWVGPSLELQAGSRTGFLFDTRFMSIGLRVAERIIDVRMGLGYGWRLMVNQDRDSEPLLLGARDLPDAVFYLDGEIEVVPRWRVRFAAQLGSQLPMAMLGASYDL